MWNALRDRRFRGIKFRRQHVLHPFIVDFYASALKLVIEIDGPQHDDPRARWVDAQRDAELIALGYVVLRIPAYAVRTDAAAIVAQLVEIRRAAERRARSMRDQRTF